MHRARIRSRQRDEKTDGPARQGWLSAVGCFQAVYYVVPDLLSSGSTKGSCQVKTQFIIAVTYIIEVFGKFENFVIEAQNGLFRQVNKKDVSRRDLNSRRVVWEMV